MAKSKSLTDEQNKARARRDSHKYRHKTNNLPARTANKAARLAAQWVQQEHPQKWAALVREAQAIEAGNGTQYMPHAVRFSKNPNTCQHGNIVAVGIATQCADCGTLLGSYAVEVPGNKEMLQDILEAEGGA